VSHNKRLREAKQDIAAAGLELVEVVSSRGSHRKLLLRATNGATVHYILSTSSSSYRQQQNRRRQLARLAAELDSTK
jgi:hypothetical protein